jgi:uncharacterized delta-60 repeat protein
MRALSSRFFLLNLLVLLAFLVSAMPGGARAAAGDLDLNFGTAGVWNPSPECCGPSRAHAVAIQADGKVVMAGQSSTGFVPQVMVARINTDGTPDTAFGTQGVTNLALSDSFSEARGVTIAADGSIFVAGNYNDFAGLSQAFVVKLDASGQPAASFGNAGIAKLGALVPYSSAIARAVRLQGDGRVVIGGRLTLTSGDLDMFVARLTAAGALDTTFGGTGMVHSGASGNDEAYAIAIAPSGSILLAGQAHIGSDDYPSLMEVLPNGATDPSLNGTGMKFPIFNFPGTLRAAVFQPDGKILLAGSANSRPAAIRLLASGAVDNTYNGSGVQQSFAANSSDIASDIVLQPDGRQVVYWMIGAAAARLNVDGSIDGTWNFTTQVDHQLFPLPQGNEMAIGLAPDGTVWLAGAIQDDQVYSTAAFAFDSTGHYASTVGGPGHLGFVWVDTGLALPTGSLQSVAHDASGRLYSIRRRFCGYQYLLTGCTTVARIDANGAADPTFGNAGRVDISSPAKMPGGSIAVRPADGRVFFDMVGASGIEVWRLNADGSSAGSFATSQTRSASSSSNFPPGLLTYPGSDTRLLLVSNQIGRYLDDGTLDPSFHLGSVIDLGTRPDDAVLAPDGSIFTAYDPLVIGGYGPSLHDAQISKWLADGSVDTTFGNNGVVTLNLNNGIYVNKIAVQPDGKLLVAGSTHYTPPAGNGSMAFVARLTTSGALDPTFLNTGVTYVPAGPYPSNISVVGISLRGDGKIIVAGGVIPPGSPNPYWFTARFHPTGNVDPSYGTGGIEPFQASNGYDIWTTMDTLPDGSLALGGATDAAAIPNGRVAIAKLLATGYAFALTPDSLHDGGVSVPYTGAITSNGSSGPFTYALANGTLPPGLAVASDGTLSGTPTTAGTYEFVIRATDSTSAIAAHFYTLTVRDTASLITSYYQTILGRAPDAGGLTFWQSEAQRMVNDGVDVSEAFFALAGVFFNSPEYLQRNTSNTQYVTDLYTTFFNRTPDAGGLAFWRTQLDTGRPRGAVLNEFLFSPEFVQYMGWAVGSSGSRPEVSLVLDFYRGLLGRLPDDGGLAFWVAQMRTAQCTSAAAVTSTANAISQQFTTSTEYAQRDAARPAFQRNELYVMDLYSAFMRRGADVSGLTYYETSITNGSLSREQVRQVFVASTEFQNRVAAVIAAGCSP